VYSPTVRPKREKVGEYTHPTKCILPSTHF
jgi:hypothetical protein